MLNMNSPTVQNLIKTGFNPYNGYTPQQPMYQQQEYYNYNPYGQPQQEYYNYNPYMQPNQDIDMISSYTNSYDPMPSLIINEARGINSYQPMYQQQPIMQQQAFNSYYNPYAFNGYSNPYMMKSQGETERIRQREEAIQQGKIWRNIFKNVKYIDKELDIDDAVKTIESMYYYEPKVEEIPIKDKIIIDKNNHIAEIEARLLYYRQNNIHVPDPLEAKRNYFFNYYNNINSFIGDIDNCDMVDYFNRVYPELKFRELEYNADKFNKNLKNKYNNNNFDTLLTNAAKDRPDSYYEKIMETFAETGVRLKTSSGNIITADEMEIRLPDRLLKNKQNEYYEQRKKFFNSVFKKEG